MVAQDEIGVGLAGFGGVELLHGVVWAAVRRV